MIFRLIMLGFSTIKGDGVATVPTTILFLVEVVQLEFESSFTCLFKSVSISFSPIVGLSHFHTLVIKFEPTPIRVFSSKSSLTRFETRTHIIDRLHLLTTFDIDGLADEGNFAHKNNFFAHELDKFFFQLVIGILNITSHRCKALLKELALFYLRF